MQPRRKRFLALSTTRTRRRPIATRRDRRCGSSGTAGADRRSHRRCDLGCPRGRGGLLRLIVSAHHEARPSAPRASPLAYEAARVRHQQGHERRGEGGGEEDEGEPPLARAGAPRLNRCFEYAAGVIPSCNRVPDQISTKPISPRKPFLLNDPIRRGALLRIELDPRAPNGQEQSGSDFSLPSK